MSALWHPAYVGIGSNLKSPRDRVLQAVDLMRGLNATRLESRSKLYLSQPMGPQDQPHFVNAAVGLLTQLNPHELLTALLGIETSMGRDRGERWGPRVIDLDLLWMVDAAVNDESLTVPHPGVSIRNFVLYPLADIAPTLKIPGAGIVSDLKAHIGATGISVLEQDS